MARIAFPLVRKTIRPIRCRVSCFLTCEPHQGDLHSAGSSWQCFACLLSLRKCRGLKTWTRKGLLITIVRSRITWKVSKTRTRKRKRNEMWNCWKCLRNEKSDGREVQNIEAAEWNKHLSDFIRSVRRKDGEYYEPSSVRCLVSSIERHLK